MALSLKELLDVVIDHVADDDKVHDVLLKELEEAGEMELHTALETHAQNTRREHIAIVKAVMKRMENADD